MTSPTHVPPIPRARRGFALPMALGMLLIIAGLLAGVFAMSTQQGRIGSNAFVQERAFRASELGLNATIGQWNPALYAALPTGGVVTTVHDSAGSGFRTTVRVMRLGKNHFVVTSDAVAGSGSTASRRRTSTAVRLVYPSFNFQGALTARGSVSLAGSTYINGSDVPPPGWDDCPPLQPTLPGLAVSPGAYLDFHNCARKDLRCVDGNPDTVTTAAAADTNTYFNFGDVNWNKLVASASLTLDATGANLPDIDPVVGADGRCNTASPNNWGDMRRQSPAGPCESYFPVIYLRGVNGQTHLTGNGQGQGILIVDGDLDITGGFRWAGIIITRGHFQASGSGVVLGAVLAGNVTLETTSLSGNHLINFSSCAVRDAALGAPSSQLVGQRAWVDLY